MAGRFQRQRLAHRAHRARPWALWNGTSPDGFVGQMWLRTTVTLTAEQARRAGPVLDLGQVNEEDETWINGMDVGSSSFAARTTHPVRAGVLKEGVNVIATNIFCSWRNCGIRGPADMRAIRFADGSSVPLSDPWKYWEVPNGLIAPQMPWGVTHGLTMNYNGMVAGLGPFGLKGAVWYQGESNIYFAQNYRTTLLAMMSDWRRQFENPDLPFLIVQLPNYGLIPTQPVAVGLGGCPRSATPGGSGRQARRPYRQYRYRRSQRSAPHQQARCRPPPGHRRPQYRLWREDPALRSATVGGDAAEQ